jgi:twinkle protein
MKVRAAYPENKSKMRIHPASSPFPGIFGLNVLEENDKIIVITEGEYDAMAVHQATGLPAVSLPNGANHLPKQLRPFFERFERMYLWMDADLAGQTAAEKFAKKFGLGRTLIINAREGDKDGPKDANEALLRGYDLKEIIKGAKTISQRSILTISDMKDKLINRIINQDELMGVKSQYFNFFNKTLGGLRKGEFTLVSGASGSGKTTFLSQLSIDFLT